MKAVGGRFERTCTQTRLGRKRPEKPKLGIQMDQADMISESELEERLERARGNPVAEQEFFQVLLDATVYAHVPISDDSANIRMILFRHPAGFDASPFFTSEAKAHAAAGHSAKVVKFVGRSLLEITRGAILMLNPNDGGPVLYPEEVEALLTGGAIPQLRGGSLPGAKGWFGSPDWLPSWLIPELTRTLKQQGLVNSAYVLQTAPEANKNDISLLIVLGVAPQQAERVARACITSMQSEIDRSPPELAIDLTVFDPAQGVPDFVSGSGVEPFYRPEP
jgi:hypothetical protein